MKKLNAKEIAKAKDREIETCLEWLEYVATPSQVMDLNLSHKKLVKKYFMCEIANRNFKAAVKQYYL